MRVSLSLYYNTPVDLPEQQGTMLADFSSRKIPHGNSYHHAAHERQAQAAGGGEDDGCDRTPRAPQVRQRIGAAAADRLRARAAHFGGGPPEAAGLPGPADLLLRRALLQRLCDRGDPIRPARVGDPDRQPAFRPAHRIRHLRPADRRRAVLPAGHLRLSWWGRGVPRLTRQPRDQGLPGGGGLPAGGLRPDRGDLGGGGRGGHHHGRALPARTPRFNVHSGRTDRGDPEPARRP